MLLRKNVKLELPLEMDGAGQCGTGGQRSSDPTTAQGGSEAAPPSTSGTTPLAIQFTPDELQQLDAEVQHLSQCSVICRVIGSRPNKGELWGLLYAKMQQGAEVIQDAKFLGRDRVLQCVDCSRDPWHEPVGSTWSKGLLLTLAQGLQRGRRNKEWEEDIQGMCFLSQSPERIQNLYE